MKIWTIFASISLCYNVLLCFQENLHIQLFKPKLCWPNIFKIYSMKYIYSQSPCIVCFLVVFVVRIIEAIPAYFVVSGFWPIYCTCLNTFLIQNHLLGIFETLSYHIYCGVEVESITLIDCECEGSLAWI